MSGSTNTIDPIAESDDEANQLQDQKANDEDINIESTVNYLYVPKKSIKISSDRAIALEQYKVIQEIEMNIISTKCDAFDALSVLIGFLLAFAFGDVMNLDFEGFDSEILFIIFTMFIISTTLFGTFALILISFITIQLRRKLAGDEASALYFEDWRLDALRRDKHASIARAWYEGWYYDDKYEGCFDKNKEEFDNFYRKYDSDDKEHYDPGYTPRRVVRIAMYFFLCMLVCYVAAMLTNVIDVYYTFSQVENNDALLIIPILFACVFIIVACIIFKWLSDRNALNKIA